MALTPSVPGVTGLATTTDFRKAIAGLIVKNTSGVARSGVFPAHGNALVSARGDLNVDIGAFQAAGVQFGGPVLFANDGTAQLPVALVSPVSGTNWYVVYAKQNEGTAPGTDGINTTIFGAVLSTSSFATARASGTRLEGGPVGLPTGAVELGTVQLPTGKTATNAIGVTITATHQFTAAAGGVVWVRNETEGDLLPAQVGLKRWRLDTGCEETYFGTGAGGTAVAGWYPTGGIMPRQILAGKAIAAVSITPATYGFLSRAVYFDVASTRGDFPTPSANYLFKVGLAGRYSVEVNVFYGGADTSTLSIHAFKTGSVAPDSITGAFARCSNVAAGSIGGLSFTTEVDLAANAEVNLVNWFAAAGMSYSDIPKWSATIRYIAPILS